MIGRGTRTKDQKIKSNWILEERDRKEGWKKKRGDIFSGQKEHLILIWLQSIAHTRY